MKAPFSLVRSWLEAVLPRLPHDRAVPGTSVLDVALMRMLRARVFKLKGQYVASVLLDVKQFYEHIEYQQSMRYADEVDFPPMLLNFALQAYTGCRVIARASEPIWAQRGVLAGRTIAPVLAKVVMMPIIRKFKERIGVLQCDVWVDDVSVAGDRQTWPCRPCRLFVS